MGLVGMGSFSCTLIGLKLVTGLVQMAVGTVTEADNTQVSVSSLNAVITD